MTAYVNKSHGTLKKKPTKMWSFTGALISITSEPLSFDRVLPSFKYAAAETKNEYIFLSSVRFVDWTNTADWLNWY